MVTVQDNLVRELKAAVSHNNRGFLNLPGLASNTDTTYYPVYVVKGITEPDYEKLNGTVVYGLPKGIDPSARVIRKTGKLAKGPNGEILREKVTVPSGSTAVRTPINLELSWDKWKNPPEGYGYVDFFNNVKAEPQYLYILPDAVLFEINQCSLVISNKKLARVYTDLRIQTWEHGVVYFSIVPLTNRSFTRAKILANGVMSSFSAFLPKLLKTWVVRGVMPNPDYFNMDNRPLVMSLGEGVLEPPPMVSEESKAVKGKSQLIADEISEEY